MDFIFNILTKLNLDYYLSSLSGTMMTTITNALLIISLLIVIITMFKFIVCKKAYRYVYLFLLILVSIVFLTTSYNINVIKLPMIIIDKKSKDVTLHEIKVNGKDHFFIELIQNNVKKSFNISSDKDKLSCVDYSYILTELKYQFLIVGNIITSTNNKPIVEIECINK